MPKQTKEPKKEWRLQVFVTPRIERKLKMLAAFHRATLREVVEMLVAKAKLELPE